MKKSFAISIICLGFAMAGNATAESNTNLPPIKFTAQAQTIRHYQSNATQGVAVSGDSLYAVSNSSIVRLDKKSGKEITKWQGDPEKYRHINSCNIIFKELVCASSNYPKVPHLSTIEFFNPVTLEHTKSRSLGFGTGSITWVDYHNGAYWAVFANYDGRGAEAPRDHRHTTLVKFDKNWQRQEAWAIPATILERIAPMSISGGGWGPDGRLYLTGHDLPELYAVKLPDGGGTLEHTATIAIEAEGQAIDWDETSPGMLYGIMRKTKDIVAMKVPILPHNK